jgi:hypothetical protein
MCFFIFFCQESCLNFSISEVDLWIHFVQKVFQKLYWLSEMWWIKDPLILFARIKFVQVFDAFHLQVCIFKDHLSERFSTEVWFFTDLLRQYKMLQTFELLECS